jgi:hypothetical protein
MEHLVSADQMSLRWQTDIEDQEKHHRKRTFEEEFIELLFKHGINYDPQYVPG